MHYAYGRRYPRFNYFARLAPLTLGPVSPDRPKLKAMFNFIVLPVPSFIFNLSQIKYFKILQALKIIPCGPMAPGTHFKE